MHQLTHTVNVGRTERLASIVGGSLLLLDSIFNKSFRGYKAAAGGYLLFRGISGNCLAYKLAGKQEWRQFTNVNIRTRMLIHRSPRAVYNLWRNFENLPQFMKHLVSVKEVYENIYEWKADIPGKTLPLQWKACLIMDIPGEVISWKSLPDALIENAGKIEFRQIDEHTTDLHVMITYKPPMGLLGGVAADFFHEKLYKLVKEDIGNFKEFAERQIGVVNELKDITV
jgi:uncharacterized membrane protein